MQLIFLGRDGVINEYLEAGVLSIKSWQAIPGSLRAIARLNSARYRVVVTTNQPALAAGSLDHGTLDQIHAKMRDEISREGGAIDAIAYCPHRADDKCGCRKPQPGLLIDIARRLGIELTEVPMVGDSLEDIRAASAVQARPILVRTGFGRNVELRGEGIDGIEVYDDLASAVDAILAGQ
jgi:D-glycero-D-manno-heptose 1,7-bisphosphate phosphatase